jgi:succinate-semialdehyde dehydrogenase/glutarate-semialdehyde dehydrogenase
MTITTVNPATGKPLSSYKVFSAEKVTATIQATAQAQQQWQTTSFAERKQRMLAFAVLLQKKQKALAESITQEMGKPITQSMSEVEKCIWLCEHYAENAAVYLTEEVVPTEMRKSYVCYQPLGVIFAIMPWNFPLWQVLRFAVPNIMAGNAALVKPALNVMGTGLMIESLFKKAGFPTHLCRVLVIEVEQASQVIAHPQVAGVTLTGSVSAGKAVAQQAASALKKVMLELGGSDPYLILADANLEQAVEACLFSRLNNAGQVCIAAKRIILVPEVAERFKQLLLEKVALYSLGNPQLATTKLGPMARKDLRDTVHQQVTTSIQHGAKLLVGGTVPAGDGFYYPVTVLDAVKPGMPAYSEEIFGPVIALLEAQDEADAIRIANDVSYGLGAALFTQDIARGEEIACKQIRAGTCFVNRHVASDPRLPFGGIKHSGFGRELGREGIREFVNIKTIAIA